MKPIKTNASGSAFEPSLEDGVIDETPLLSSTPAPSPSAPIDLDAPRAVGLKGKVLREGMPMIGMPTEGHVEGKPGIYRVTHGRICFGHSVEGGVYATQGALVELDASEAGRMLEEGTVELVRAA